MRLHLIATEWEGRIYPDGDKPLIQCYEDEDDWRGSLLIRRTYNTAWISLLQEKFNRKILKQLTDFAYSQGCTDIQWRGNHRHQILTERQK